MSSRKRHVICMASDFFYPNVGGVEEHIFQLSQCLMSLGHKVIVATHGYDDRKGIRYMTGGLKVYYLPIRPFYNQSALPTFLTSIALFRNLLIRERVTIVHGHSAFSTMAHEMMNVARALGLRTVFTDHSLFGFADLSAIVTNNFLSLSLTDVNHCICVSYVGKENTVLRAKVCPSKVSVIPNALDTTHFKPEPEKRPKDRINVIALCRLQYRKGVDLQPDIIRNICAKYPQVNFIIGGDGPKRGLLEEVRDKLGGDRVRLEGALPHSKVHSILVQGHIFLNTSLIEAFCIAICEAASSGLHVVSTKVGGIPEVLPPELISLASPTVESLTQVLSEAIDAEIEKRSMDPFERHRRAKELYSWSDIGRRTEHVYDLISSEEDCTSLPERARKYMKCGPFAGAFMIFLVSLQSLLFVLLEFVSPSSSIDLVTDEGDSMQVQGGR